jgi:hypothetical protein
MKSPLKLFAGSFADELTALEDELVELIARLLVGTAGELYLRARGPA